MSTILVVDDQPIHRIFLVSVLSYFNHNVLEAGDGGQALECLHCHRVDLVIADILMPTMDGYDLLQRMRAGGEFEHTPVIFYTAADYESDARAMAEAFGVRHFLNKPAEPQALVSVVNDALGLGTIVPDLSPIWEKISRHGLIAPADPIDPNAVVFVVDNDSVQREFFSQTMTGACLKVETFCTAEEFLQEFDENRPGCLILDIALPGMTGIALLEILRSRRMHIPVIIVTGHDHIASAVDAIRLRVVDFLIKPVERRILLTKAHIALQEDAIERRKRVEVDAVRRRIATLTTCEMGLMELLVVGKTTKEIAVELQISGKTVSHHRAHLMAKTHAANLADLVRMRMIASQK